MWHACAHIRQEAPVSAQSKTCTLPLRQPDPFFGKPSEKHYPRFVQQPLKVQRFCASDTERTSPSFLAAEIAVGLIIIRHFLPLYCKWCHAHRVQSPLGFCKSTPQYLELFLCWHTRQERWEDFTMSKDLKI